VKFLVKVIEVPDIGNAEVHELIVEAPNHTAAIWDVMDQIGGEIWTPTEARSLAYVADKVDRNPHDEPEALWLFRFDANEPWRVQDGETQRDATEEENEMLRAAGKEVGFFQLKNSQLTEGHKPQRKR
jgi:hypothetical protein